MQKIIIICLIFIQWQAFGQPYGTGLIFNDEKYERAPMKANFRDEDYDDLPTAYSLKKYSPSPGNQLQLNTSPAWAVTWSAATMLEALRNGWTDREQITRQTSAPAFTYYHIKPPGDNTCEAGASLYDALSFMKNKGAKKYLEFLEFCPKNLPEDITPEDRTIKIGDFRKLFDWDTGNKARIKIVKKSISENLPVVIGMYCPPSFFRAKNYWQPAELMSTEFPGQALCVIGYDDDKYGGAFEVINSWGHEWGNEGYMWIRYGDFADFVKYGYEVFNVNESKEGYHEFSGKIKLILHTRDTVPVTKKQDGIYETASSLPTGTFFRLLLQHDSPVFVYVFGFDQSHEFFRIFPHRDNISPAIVYERGLLNVPGEDSYIEITGEPGQETLCVLFSKKPLDFKQVLSQLKERQGDVRENLYHLLDGNLMESEAVNWHEKEIIFSAGDTDRSAVLIRILIDHS